MRCLLIQSSLYDKSYDKLPNGLSDGMTANTGVFQPLGICYVAAVLKRAGMEVKIIDPDASQLQVMEIVRKIKRYSPQIIGISSTSFTFIYGIKLATEIKKACDIPIVIGGNHVPLYPKELMSHECFDVGINGDGEFVFLEIARLIEKHGKAYKDYLSNLKGVAFYNDGKFTMTEYVTTKDLDSLPLPARELLDVSKYGQAGLNRKFAAIITARGCPYSCSFCSESSEFSRWRARSIKNIIQEVEECYNRWKVDAVHFVDDTFTLNKGRTIALCNELAKSKATVDFSILTRADCLDDDIMAALKKAGCGDIYFGIESGDNNVLKRMNKKATNADTFKAISLCKKHKIRSNVFLLIGFPDETRQELQNTIRMIKKLYPSWFKANVVTPYPGTAMYLELVKRGEIDDFWREITLAGRKLPFPNISRHFSHEELIRLRDRINRMPYTRFPSNLLHLGRFTLDIFRNPDHVKRRFNFVFSQLTDGVLDRG